MAATAAYQYIYTTTTQFKALFPILFGDKYKYNIQSDADYSHIYFSHNALDRILEMMLMLEWMVFVSGCVWVDGISSRSRCWFCCWRKLFPANTPYCVCMRWSVGMEDAADNRIANFGRTRYLLVLAYPTICSPLQQTRINIFIILLYNAYSMASMYHRATTGRQKHLCVSLLLSAASMICQFGCYDGSASMDLDSVQPSWLGRCTQYAQHSIKDKWLCYLYLYDTHIKARCGRPGSQCTYSA